MITNKKLEEILSNCEGKSLFDRIKELESKITDLEPDALYLRKWREIRGSNPEIPCACVIDENENWIRKCGFHERIVGELEESISYLKKAWGEELAHSQQAEERIRELEEGIREWIEIYTPYYESGAGTVGSEIYERLNKLLKEGT